MAGKAKPAGRNGISRTVLVLFVGCLSTLELSVSFNGTSLDVMDSMRWASAGSVPPMSSIVAVLLQKSHRRSSEQLLAGLAVNEARHCKSLLQSNCSMFCGRCYFSSGTVKESRAFCTASSVCSEMSRFLVGY